MLRTMTLEQLPSYEPGVERVLHQAEIENIALVRSLPQQQVAVAIIMTATGTLR